MARSQAAPAALEVEFSMLETAELQATARKLLKARPLDPAAILALVHHVRANVVWALEQVEAEAMLPHSEVAPEAWRTLETKREAFETLSKRLFMPVAMGWRSELFARAALAEFDATGEEDEPMLAVEEVITKFYTVTADSPHTHQLGSVYTEGQLDELDLLRRTFRRTATNLRRLSSREEARSSLAYIARRRPGLLELTRGWIKSGLAYGDKVERAIAADENDTPPPSSKRIQPRQSIAETSPSRTRTRSPFASRSSNPRGSRTDEPMDLDDREPRAPGPSSQQSRSHKAPRLGSPVVRPPSTEPAGREVGTSSREKSIAAAETRIATLGSSRIPPRDLSPADSRASRHSQSQAPTFAIVVPFRNRLKDAARSEQARLAVKPPVPVAFDPVKAAHTSVHPAAESASRIAASSPAPPSKPSKGKGRPSTSDEANTSGNTTTSSALEPPPPGQRMQSPELSGAIPQGAESHEAAGDPTPDEGSSLEQPETVAETQSDDDDGGALPGRPGSGQFGKLNNEATEEVDDASEVGRLADETDRDVHSL